MNSNIMEKASEIAQNHKILILCILLAVLFLILLMLLLSSGMPQKKSNNSIQNPTNTKNNQNNGQNISQNPDTSSWLKGNANDYLILFPPEWAPTTQAVSGGGTFVTIQPVKAAEISIINPYPQITIQSTPVTNINADQIINSLSPLGFVKKKAAFESLPAVTLSGTLPIKPTKDNPNQNLIHVTYIVFENNKNAYKISLTDFIDASQKANEDLMQKIVNTMQLN